MAIIYLDYAATTPVANEVTSKMMPYLTSTGIFANPASIQHSLGKQAEKIVEQSRLEIATILNTKSQKVYFTSGATESNNLVLKGLAFSKKHQGKHHIITSATEHKSILDCCKFLETQGFHVTYLRPDKTGLLDLDKLASAITRQTLIVSIMQVNNETGVIQDIAAIAKLCQQKNVFFHVDAAQSIGKLALDLATIKIDFLSVSGHKFYAPKGIGCLVIRDVRAADLMPLFHGGGQEKNLRAGTLPVHQVVAMSAALTLQQQRLQKDWNYLTQLRHCLFNTLSQLEGVQFNGNNQYSVPHIINVSFDDIPSEALLIALHETVAIATGSACNSGAMEASHVLRAMGIEGDRLYNAVRISFGRYTTKAEIKQAGQEICTQVQRLRALT
ncbi:MAG: cysteine desulfurase [Methylococcales bacterium]|nr:cysteine desulfurase [Methylococcales bacterium]MCK5925184.1 cysteine desulfurase [Methylococcales bacterium]